MYKLRMLVEYNILYNTEKDPAKLIDVDVAVGNPLFSFFFFFLITWLKRFNDSVLENLSISNNIYVYSSNSKGT